MLNKNKLLIILTLLILIPLSSAEEDINFNLNSVSVTWNGPEDEITRITSNPTPPLSGFLRFTYTANNEVTGTIDVSQLVPVTERQTLTINDFRCETDEGTTECVLGTPIRLTIEDSNPEITFKLEVEGENVVETRTLNLQLYDANPTVSSIRTNSCEDDICYLKDGEKIIIDLTGTEVGFNRMNVAYRIGSETSLVDFCSDNTCEATINKCEDGRTINVQIPTTAQGGQSTRDNAGNRLARNFKEEIICDNTAPEITGMKTTDLDGGDLITITDRFYLTVNATDSTSHKLKITANLTEIGGDAETITCDGDEEFSCTTTLQATAERSGVYNIPVTVRDVAGNENTDNIEVRLLGVDEEETNFWTLSNVKLSNSNLNKENLVFSRQINGEVSLNTDAGVELTSAEFGRSTCTPTRDTLGNDGDVRDLRIMHVNGDKFYFVFTLSEAGSIENNRYSDFTILEYECSFEVTSRDDDFFYNFPEKINFTINMRLDESRGHFGKKLYEEKQIQQEKIEGRLNRLQVLDKLSISFGTLCNITGHTTSAQGALSIAGLAFESASSAFPPLKPGSRSFAVSQVSAREGLENFNRIASYVCFWFDCSPGSSPLGGSSLDSMMDGMDDLFPDKISQTLGYETLSQSLNPYNSEAIAYLYTCLPAIQHHQYQKLDIECSYQQCLAFGVEQMGQTVEQCQDLRNYAQCIRKTDSLANTIPFNNLILEFGERMEQVFKDPLAAASVSFDAMCLGQSKLRGLDSLDAVAAAKLPKSARYFMYTCSLKNSVAQYAALAGQIAKLQDDIRDFQLLSSGIPQSCETVQDRLDTESLMWRTGQTRTERTELEDYDDLGFTGEFEFKGENRPFTVNCHRSMCSVDDSNYYVNALEIVDGEGKFNADNFFDGNIYRKQKGVYTTQGTIDDQIKRRRKSAETGEKVGDDQPQPGSEEWFFNNFEDRVTVDDAHSAFREYNEDSQITSIPSEPEEITYGLPVLSMDDLRNVAYAAVGSEFHQDRYKDMLVNEYGSEHGENIYANSIRMANINRGDTARQYRDFLNKDVEFAGIISQNEDLVDPDRIGELSVEIAVLKGRDDLSKEEQETLAEYEKELNNRVEAMDKLDGAFDSRTDLRNNAFDAFKDDNALLYAASQKGEGVEYDADTGKYSITDKDAFTDFIMDSSPEKLTEMLDDENRRSSRTSQREQSFIDHYGSYAKGMRTMWNNVDSINMLRGTLDWDWGVNQGGWMSSSTASVDLIEGAQDYFSFNKVCESKAPNTFQSEMPLVSQGRAGFSSGATLNARKSYDDINEEYSYWLAGGLNTKEPGLRFRIIFKGTRPDSGRSVTTDLTEDIFHVNVVEMESTQKRFSGDRTEFFKSKNNYDKACLVIESRNLGTYFDNARGLENELCTTIVKE